MTDVVFPGRHNG